MLLKTLYIFGIPGRIGGAATKVRHLIYLLREAFNIKVVFSDPSCLKHPEVISFLKRLNIPYYSCKDLPDKAEGIALAICDRNFFQSGTAKLVKTMGLKLVWSNEMMWAFEEEAEAAKAGLVDKVLFVSDFQAAAFADMYCGVSSTITGNYVAPEDFEFVARRNATFTIGRLSRPDREKYPADFPVFYEELGLSDVRYRVMAWDNKLTAIYNWHRFGPEWNLLAPGKEPTDRFLQSLDLFVYPLGYRIKESWGRSTVEAMLTGAVPVVPAGHQFHNLMVHGESGFICRTFAEYHDVVRELHDNHPLRVRISRQCAEHARSKLCNPAEHREAWVTALTS